MIHSLNLTQRNAWFRTSLKRSDKTAIVLDLLNVDTRCDSFSYDGKKMCVRRLKDMTQS